MYSETSRPWFFWLLLALVLVMVGLYGWWWSETPTSDEEGEIVALIIVAVLIFPYMIWMVFACSVYIVQFDGNTLTFGYLAWKVSLTTSEIISAQASDIRWIAWGGMGWRLRGLKKIGYIVKSGPGIEIQSSRKGRIYTFNCQDPTTLLASLERAMVPIQKNLDD